MRKLAILASTMLFSTTAFSANNATIFSCTAENGQAIKVEKVGNDYAFSYGKVKFKNPVKQVVASEGSNIAGGSGFISSSLEMKDKGVTYLIDFAQPRNAPKEIDDPMLSIDKAGNTEIIRCDSSKKVYQNFERKIMRKTGFSI